MSEKVYNDDNKQQVETAKLNLVYVGILSVVMLFAGLTSAYIVSMGDSFWLKAPFPSAFYISTAIIILSSITFQLAIVQAKKNNLGGLKGLILLTFALGLGFVYFQIKGYGQFTDSGIRFVNNHIIVTDGKYGDYFDVKINGKYLEVDGNDFLIGNQKLSDETMKSYQNYMSQFLDPKVKEPFKVKEGSKEFELLYLNKPLIVVNGDLVHSDSSELEYVEKIRLRDLARNVRDGRGDFFARGEIGKDFNIYYKGKPLEYKNRTFYFEGKELTAPQQVKAMESADTASSYLYLITLLHLLHIVITLLYLIKIVIHSLSGKIDADNTIRLRMGATFWHFLGILWLFLLLFLLFIH